MRSTKARDGLYPPSEKSFVPAGSDGASLDGAIESDATPDFARQPTSRRAQPTRTPARPDHDTSEQHLQLLADLAGSPAAAAHAFASIKRATIGPAELKALAEPLGGLIKELLDENPDAFTYLQPYLRTSPGDADRPMSRDPTDHSEGLCDQKLKSSVEPVGKLIRDFLKHWPEALEYLQPYLPTSAPFNGREATSG